MIQNNNLSILPFYDSVEKQNHRKDYAFGEVFCLASPNRRILPFQFVIPHTPTTSSTVYLKKLDGTSSENITSQMEATGLKSIENAVPGYDLVVYPGKLLMVIDTPEGQYYLELVNGGVSHYSEVFTVVRNLQEYLKLSYSCNCNLEYKNGLIDFSDNFIFEVYLPTQLGRPDYPFEEEVEKRDGYTFVEKQISEKTFKFDFLAPEYLLDAMRIIRMSDNILITSKGVSYEVDTFLMTPEWEDGGYLAGVNVEFQCDTVIKKIGGVVPLEIGDFNDDFNNDFNNN